jgi:DNA-binding NtrC family response regulator
VSGQTLSSPGDEGAGESVRVRALHVVYASRPPATPLVPLGRPFAIGREPGPDVGLVLVDSEISGVHARCVPGEGEAWRIVDAGSRNGVWVDGARVAEAELHPGAVVRLGACLLVMSELALGAHEPLAAETPGLLGRSLAMQRLRGEIELVAARAIDVLVRGETGAGKERVAEALHAGSGRRGRFVPVNCAALPAALAESELFGHAAGAFTGATARTEGLFAAADGGTLLLDEVAELAPAVQATLLRALATGEVRPVGGTTARRLDVRVIAATHRDLDALVATGGFRADLLARLAAWRLDVPPLRARREDVLGLAASFLGDGLRLSATAAEALLLHDWPYNVRELAQTCAAAAVRAADGVVKPAHLPPAIAARVAHRARPAGSVAPPLAALVDRTQPPTRDGLVAVLAAMHGNLADVAAYFGKDRRQVYRWLDRHGLDAARYRDAGDAGDGADAGAGEGDDAGDDATAGTSSSSSRSSA